MTKPFRSTLAGALGPNFKITSSGTSIAAVLRQELSRAAWGGNTGVPDVQSAFKTIWLSTCFSNKVVDGMRDSPDDRDQ